MMARRDPQQRETPYEHVKTLRARVAGELDDYRSRYGPAPHVERLYASRLADLDHSLRELSPLRSA